MEEKPSTSHPGSVVLEFVDFEQVEQRLRRHDRSGAVAYLVLSDRTDSRAEETLGRFDWSEPSDDIEDEEDEDDASSLMGTFNEFEDEPDTGEEQSILEHALDWLQSRVRSNYVPPMRRYRVRIYGPKGHAKLESFQFYVRGFDGLEEDQAHEPPEWPEPPRFDVAAERTGVVALDHLGRSYATFMKLMLAGIGQLQKIGAATNHQLHSQLVDARKQNDRLIAAFIESQAEALKVEREGLDVQKAQAQMQLGQQALRTFDEATRLYLMTSRGLPPELQAVVNAVSNNPALMQTLSDPKVQQLLGDPQAQAQLGALLQMAAQQIAPHPGPTSDPSPEPPAESPAG